MKKVLAIILSIAMLFGVLAINTFAETTDIPKVTLITNEGSPVEVGTPTYFTVKFENYKTVKAFDVTITVPKTVTLSDITATGLQAEGAKENVNYTINDNVVRFVDLTTTNNQPKITFAAKVTDENVVENPVITVSGEYATSGTSKTAFEAGIKGTFELKQEIPTETVTIPSGETSTTVNQPAAEEGQKPTNFIPFGSVYKKDTETGKITYAKKEDNGTFNINDTGYVVNSFDIPDNGITTFGVSENEKDSTTVRFGNYSNTYAEGKTYGTMVFEGDWLALKNYYIQKGYTVQQLLDAIYKNYDKVIGGKDYVYYTIGGEQINVYKFEQKNYMWKNGDVLEYALRITDLDSTKAYAAAAFSYEKSTPANFEISENVQYVPAASAQ